MQPNRSPPLVTNLSPLPLSLVSCPVFSGESWPTERSPKSKKVERRHSLAPPSDVVPHPGPFPAPGLKVVTLYILYVNIRILKTHIVAVFQPGFNVHFL